MPLRPTLLTVVLACALTACSGAADPEPSATPATLDASATETPGTAVEAAEATELTFGDARSVSWTPTGDQVGELSITVEAVREGDFSDFAGLDGSGITDANQPFYVDAVIVNESDQDLGGLDVPLYLADSEGTLNPPWGFAEPFKPCRSGPLPTPFATGDEAELCLVFFGSPDASFESITFQPTAETPVVSWTGDPTVDKKPTGKKATGKKATGKKKRR